MKVKSCYCCSNCFFLERKGDIFVCRRDGKQKVNLISNIHEYCYFEKPKDRLNHWEKIFSQTK